MELGVSEMEVDTFQEYEVETGNKSNENNSSSDLNETEKLQVSSDLPNDVDDEDEILTIRTKKKRKELKILDSESEDENQENESIKERESMLKIDEDENQADSDDNFEHSSEEEKEYTKATIPKYKALLDSDSDSEDGEVNQSYEELKHSDNEDPEKTSKSHERPNKRNPNPKRMSAKQAMEQMKSIKSESQRLHRENYVSIPYHQPKHFSLKEFMNRKTICKPNSNDQKRFSLKMSQEELEEFAKQLEEREKEAAVFFKSDDGKNKIELDESCKLKTDNIASNLQKVEAREQNPTSSFVNEMKTLDTRFAINDLLSQQSDEIQDAGNPEINKMKSNSEELMESQISKLFATQTESQACESVTIPETEDEIIIESQEQEDLGYLHLITKEVESSLKFPNTPGIQQVLKERNVVESPVLSGSPEMLIDLESGNLITPKSKGVESLVQRFLRHTTKKKSKECTNISILSTENGKIEITNVSVALDDEEFNEQKPGAAYVKLKDSLKQVIMKRRKEEIQKRLDENKSSDKENKEDYEDGVDSEDEDHLNGEEEIIHEEEPNKETHVDEDEEEIVDANWKDNEEADESEHTDADDEDDSQDSEDSGDDNDDELAVETRPVKSRIISMFDDSDDENDTLNFELDEQKSKSLWNNATQGTQPNVDEDELLGLCSGRFDEPQKNVISQIPQTQLQNMPDESELLALCSGTFGEATQQVQHSSESHVENNVIHAPKRLESSDEENENKSAEHEVKAKHKKLRKLEFSDDEDDDTAHEAIEDDIENEELPEDEEIEEDEIPETYIDYDSEENEVEVKMTKTDKREKATEFFENEAELSESEWGSADEDEKDLDRYEIDLADEEQFDRAKLQSELGKIHMRRILDDDIREVKKLQEMLIEDEETDGIGRQRQFRWKFLNDGFDFGSGPSEEAENADLNLDEEDEILWRKMRYEREILLKKNEEKLQEMTMKPQAASSSGKKITIVGINSTSATVAQASSPFLITRKMSASRGSFLLRDNDTLSKLANITKTGGETETSSVRTAKPQNFVFASLDVPEQENSLKRKSNGPQNAETNQKKKQKLNVRKKIRLIDQLA